MADHEKLHLGDVVYHKATAFRMVVIEDLGNDNYKVRYGDKDGFFVEKVLHGFEISKEPVSPGISMRKTKKTLPAG